jgi:endoglucanase
MPRRTAVAAAAVLAALATAPAASGHHHTRFYVERDTNAGRQAVTYFKQGRFADALTMFKLSRVPQAVWFTSGTPNEVQKAVDTTMDAAERQHATAVVVAYYIPGRDCSQYSAGGAPSEAAYQQWIDAFAKGIGHRKAVVIVEPDGLALLSSEPWCGEGGGGSTGTPEDLSRVEERFREINYAVGKLTRLPQTKAYIDAGHSAWQPLDDYDAGYGEPRLQLGMVNRLMRGGIAKADGFFLNVSNYRSTSDLIAYGTALSQRLNGAHFVLDTSRNGLGPWTPPAGVYPDPQDWCNPPGRALGARPTTNTGNRLIDAFLWVKRPGESDGSCTRGLAGPEDPEYGAVDPAAGVWWPEYALGLAQRAVPPL